MRQRRGLLLLVTLVAAAAMPARGQTVVPAVGTANSGTQSAAPIPDFSGIWGRLSFPGFEPPFRGDGPGGRLLASRVFALHWRAQTIRRPPAPG
jgi:hypothetical protein